MTCRASQAVPQVGDHAELLYLDFDGVLHPADVRLGPTGPELNPSLRGHSLFEHVGTLSAVLAGRPNLQVVLSTSWVCRFGYEYAASRLPAAIRARVVGATFDETRDGFGFLSVARGLQIGHDVQRRAAKRWVAIDDETANWPVEHKLQLVESNPLLGLGDPVVLEALLKSLDGLTQGRAAPLRRATG